jgi:hypothetical protein
LIATLTQTPYVFLTGIDKPNLVYRPNQVPVQLPLGTGHQLRRRPKSSCQTQVAVDAIIDAS